MSIDWEKKIEIDTQWIERQLTNHFNEKNTKVAVRAFTPKVSGTNFSCDNLIEQLGFFLPEYVHTNTSKKNKLKSLTAKYGPLQAEKHLNLALYQEAQAFFGKKNPATDGKYGELLLFALTESILKSKMVAHKIEGLSNPKDQVKGGDGIFLGNYEIEEGVFKPAIFIGESKIMQGFSDSLDDAFESLNRFHSPVTRTEFNSMEFIVANKTFFTDSTDTDYEEIYQMLTPGSDVFRNQVMVHPILIMHNSASIATLEKKAKDSEDLELLLSSHLNSKKAKIIEKIKNKLNQYPLIEKVYVDFFCFPFNDIDYFRNGMYFNIHKVQYPNQP
ncbi:Hachiman antiphage defense system protein HamA [Flavobacterium sp. 2]|uniref:Hachiman antiphage defense system protein HamA n=1 Tax=Flavobacterium sp. 2 TaxID=308053 RepID=UPI003CF48B0C